MLAVYNLEQAEQWDFVVRSFKEYDVYWLSGYVKAFQIHGDGEPLLFHYESSVCRGINVVMKRDVADDPHFKDKIERDRYFDFATPYGYGGWIIEGEDTAGLYEAYSEWIRKNGVITEFVRFHPMLQNQEKCRDFYNVTQLGEVVHMDLNSPEDIWQNITSKNRNMIRKAIKNDVVIYNGRFPEIYEKFRVIYNSTMDKDDAEEYYYFEPEFYKSVLTDLPQNAQIFWAEKEGKVIAASIMLATNGRMNYHLSGSLREFSNIAPTNLLLYHAALWGNTNGYKTLYLGGGVGSGEDNLFKFKRAFYRGDLNRFHIGKKIYDVQKYDILCEKVMKKSNSENVKESGYFPEYRQ
ncbi:GNAT family N-acetyltransferase [Oribacterium sp. P6A1]|uniref:GNAT family N-acetyltransferase n=1 Tax=Oribacterium sp. P6A1 TaxID=1410612 RepID=UPI000561FC60|nr:GNAT family N-acetyltransferase [Oribacterium sp. P6A1]